MDDCRNAFSGKQLDHIRRFRCVNIAIDNGRGDRLGSKNDSDICRRCDGAGDGAIALLDCEQQVEPVIRVPVYDEDGWRCPASEFFSHLSGSTGVSRPRTAQAEPAIAS